MWKSLDLRMEIVFDSQNRRTKIMVEKSESLGFVSTLHEGKLKCWRIGYYISRESLDQIKQRLEGGVEGRKSLQWYLSGDSKCFGFGLMSSLSNVMFCIMYFVCLL